MPWEIVIGAISLVALIVWFLKGKVLPKRARQGAPRQITQGGATQVPPPTRRTRSVNPRVVFVVVLIALLVVVGILNILETGSTISTQFSPTPTSVVREETTLDNGSGESFTIDWSSVGWIVLGIVGVIIYFAYDRGILGWLLRYRRRDGISFSYETVANQVALNAGGQRSKVTVNVDIVLTITGKLEWWVLKELFFFRLGNNNMAPIDLGGGHRAVVVDTLAQKQTVEDAEPGVVALMEEEAKLILLLLSAVNNFLNPLDPQYPIDQVETAKSILREYLLGIVAVHPEVLLEVVDLDVFRILPAKEVVDAHNQLMVATIRGKGPADSGASFADQWEQRTGAQPTQLVTGIVAIAFAIAEAFGFSNANRGGR